MLDALGALLRPHLLIDAFGGATERELAQRDERSLLEEAGLRAAGLLGNVDFACLEALEEVVGR
jgi:hypothetical protein